MRTDIKKRSIVDCNSIKRIYEYRFSWCTFLAKRTTTSFTRKSALVSKFCFFLISARSSEIAATLLTFLVSRRNQLQEIGSLILLYFFLSFFGAHRGTMEFHMYPSTTPSFRVSKTWLSSLFAQTDTEDKSELILSKLVCF